MRKPLMIVVSGAPGSGKTTLAHTIAQHLRVPHIPRDEIMRGIEMTHGGAIDKAHLGIETYFTLLVSLCEMNVSFVTDGTIYKGVSEKDIKKRLVPHAVVVNVHARAQNEHDRFIKREKERQGWSDDWVEAHKQRLDKIYDQTVNPLDLGVPLVEVDATSDYNPPIDQLIAQIREIYEDTRPGIRIAERNVQETKED